MRALLIAGLLLMFGFSSALADNPTLTISTNNTPLNRQALALLSQEGLRRIGVDLKLVSLPSERSLVAANLGEVDGEGLRVAGLGGPDGPYPSLVQVPERFVRISFVAFSRDATISLDKGWDSLKPYRIAFINGWKILEANALGARVVHKVDKPEQLFRMLEKGRVDLVLYTRGDGVMLARKLGLPAIAPLLPALKEDVDLYLYLHKKHQALVPKLSQALRDIKADGTYNRILSVIY